MNAKLINPRVGMIFEMFLPGGKVSGRILKIEDQLLIIEWEGKIKPNLQINVLHQSFYYWQKNFNLKVKNHNKNIVCRNREWSDVK